MKNLYCYRIEAFHWMFTNLLKSSATLRYDLYYHSAERRFQAECRRRAWAYHAWSQPVICTDDVALQLRALLQPEDLAACAAASMVRMPDAAE